MGCKQGVELLGSNRVFVTALLAGCRSRSRQGMLVELACRQIARAELREALVEAPAARTRPRTTPSFPQRKLTVCPSMIYRV